jgi:signal transduction histidine kinase
MALMLIALVALSEIALRTSRPLSYVVFPALIWAALRLGRHGTTLAVAVAAGFAVWETTRQVGPFAYDDVTYSELSTQLYIAIAAISSLCLAVVVAEREAATRRLAASRRRLVRAADHERRRIEQNLHDGAQQRLTALVVQLRMFEDRAREYPDAAAGMFDDASQELTVAIEELRELAHGIHPSSLTDRGLADALRGMAMRSTMQLRLLELPESRLDPTIEATAYFVASEAIANARKHAGVDAVTVRVAVARGELRMEVADDGPGGAVAKPGSGLEGLGDRVEAVGGTLEIVSPPQGGTRILAAMPARPA